MRLPADAAEIRPWAADDLESLVRHANAWDVARHLRDRFPHPYTSDDGQAWLRHCAALDPCTAFAIAVDGAAVGGIGVTPGEDVFRHAAELGYWLGQAYWGRGIMSRVVAEFSAWAFGAFELERIFALTFEGNPASARVLEKAGFALEGRLRRAALKEGRFLDCLVYARLNPSASLGRARRS